MSRRKGAKRHPRTYGLSRNITPRSFVHGHYVGILNLISDWAPPGTEDYSFAGEYDLYVCEPRGPRTEKQQQAARANGQRRSKQAREQGWGFIPNNIPIARGE